MRTLDIDEKIDRARKAQVFWQALFIVGLLAAMAAVIFLFEHSKKQAKDRQTAALLEQQRQDVSKLSKLDPAYTLAQIKFLDEQASKIAAPDDPTVYLWKSGLEPNRNKISPPLNINQELIEILNARRFLIGSIAGTAANSSAELSDYLCDHKWFVVGESVTTSKPDDWLKDRIGVDPRYKETAFVTGPVHPNAKGLVVGWFLNREAADTLASTINMVDKTQPFKKSWDFGTLAPNCSSAPE